MITIKETIRTEFFYTPDDFKTKNDVISFLRVNQSNKLDTTAHFLCDGQCMRENARKVINADPLVVVDEYKPVPTSCSHYQETWSRFTHLMSYKEFSRTLDLRLLGNEVPNYMIRAMKLEFLDYQDGQSKDSLTQEEIDAEVKRLHGLSLDEINGELNSK